MLSYLAGFIMQQVQKRIYFFLVILLTVGIVLLAFSIGYGFVISNWSMVYTIILTIPLILISRLFLLLPNMFFSKDTIDLHSKKANFFRFSWIFILKNVVAFIPFLVCAVVTFSTTSGGIEGINECKFFNIWMCFALTIFATFLWMITNIATNYKRNKKLK